eukprot:TRINITY_DN1059_c0_g1_i2.p9 TRINITY_DN1059_c0_g1~~TRINITY_DN1059_c0_g1_i2.p9  ORF type:complete len:124 (+),score=17.86 TRINITY_DN1059_c0_g1_i2:3258-3629(+)
MLTLCNFPKTDMPAFPNEKNEPNHRLKQRKERFLTSCSNVRRWNEHAAELLDKWFSLGKPARNQDSGWSYGHLVHSTFTVNQTQNTKQQHSKTATFVENPMAIDFIVVENNGHRGRERKRDGR